jgi:hypothetical protein
MKYLVSFLSSVCVRLLSTRKVRELVQQLAQKKVALLPPKEGLILLLELDSFLFKLTHGPAIAYNNGVHPCQRILNYKNYYIQRIHPNELVMDVGSHEGTVCKAVAEATGARVIGVELLAERVEKAQRENSHPNVRYLHGDALTLPIDEPVSTIVLSAVLEHIEPRVAFLQSLIQKYNPRQILIRVPMFTREYRVALRKELGLRYQMDSTHYIEYTRQEFMDEMSAAGLDVADFEIEWGEIYATCVPQSRLNSTLPAGASQADTKAPVSTAPL